MGFPAVLIPSFIFLFLIRGGPRGSCDAGQALRDGVMLPLVLLFNKGLAPVVCRTWRKVMLRG